MFIHTGQQFPCSWIQVRIRIPNTDPAKSMRLQIHNTGKNVQDPDPGFHSIVDPDPQSWRSELDPDFRMILVLLLKSSGAICTGSTDSTENKRLRQFI